jgi:uncharacterized protein YdhG (YjbR/CyaY superfamily)
MPTNPMTIDGYLAGLDPDKRLELERLRKSIRAAAPDAEECITYGLPGFRLHGKPLAAFCAASTHLSFYPMSGSIVEAFKKQLKEFETSKGTVRFNLQKPIPTTLIRRLVNARIAEIEKSVRTPAAKRPRRPKPRQG